MSPAVTMAPLHTRRSSLIADVAYDLSDLRRLFRVVLQRAGLEVHSGRRVHEPVRIRRQHRGTHTTLLLLDVADTLGLAFLFFVREMPAKSYSDTNDNSFYWYFTIGIWIPIYLIVYVGPRIL